MDGQDNKYERRSLLAGVTVAVLMIAQQVGAKATRDAFFLSEHGSAYLPQMMVASALLSLLIAGCMAKTLLSVGPGRSVMWAFAASAGLLLGEWFFASRWPKVVSMVFYLHLGALSPIVISGFWSVVNERFDPHAAKRHVTRIAASAAGGGALGGLLAERITASLSLLTMLPVLAVLNLLCAFIVPALVRGASPATAVDSSSAGPLRISGYLKKVAAVMVLTSTAAGLIDYAVKAQAASSITEPKELAAFFAYLHAMLGLLGFAVQSCVSGKLLKRAGLGATLALLPGAVVLGASLGAVFTRLWSVVVAKGLETSVRSSAFRSGYELLYIPVQRREKRAAKTIIDVGADRLGDIAAAGLAVLAIAFVPQAVVPFTLIAAVTVSLASLALAFALQRGYVSALAASLRSGNLVLEEIAIEDATTAKTLADTMALNRDELIAEIEVLRRQSSEDGPIEATEDHSVTATTPHTPADTYFVRQVVLQRAHALLNGTPPEVNELLGEPNLEDELLPLILPWIAVSETAQPALSALRRLSVSREGQLTDALLNPLQPIQVRKMLPHVLGHLPTERARDGLLWGLRSEPFTVRYQSAQGLERLCRQYLDLRPSQQPIFAAILREQKPGDEPELERDALFVTDRSNARVVPRFDYALTLLSVLYDPEAIELCRVAFSRGDTMMRGTAAEYLENLLPSDVFGSLSPQFDIEPVIEQRQLRGRAEIVADLANSATSLNIDVCTLRKA